MRTIAMLYCSSQLMDCAAERGGLPPKKSEAQIQNCRLRREQNGGRAEKTSSASEPAPDKSARRAPTRGFSGRIRKQRGFANGPNREPPRPGRRSTERNHPATAGRSRLRAAG